VEAYEHQLLEGLRAFLQQQPAALELTEGQDWARLWHLARQQKVLPMAADTLCPPLRAAGADGAMLRTVRREAVGDMTAQIRRFSAFARLYEALAEAGCTPLLVKGAVCRGLYPKPDLRVSADEDLLVRPEELPRVRTAAEALGWTIHGTEDAQVMACLDMETGAYVELHRTLFPAGDRSYGWMNDFFAGAFEDKVRVRLEGKDYWTLSPQMHLLYLILHACKHFLHSGVGIRQVCDICLFVCAWGETLDWAALSAQLRRARAEVFAANLLDIGRRFLGFDRYPPRVERWLADCASKLDCDALLEDLLAAGIYGGSSEERLHSSLITLNAVADGSDGHGIWRVVRTVFPARRALEGKYSYLRERPWLLPAAWAQRLVTYRAQKSGASARESLEIGARRVQLLKKYGMIG
jgi:hypothetical protein